MTTRGRRLRSRGLVDCSKDAPPSPAHYCDNWCVFQHSSSFTRHKVHRRLNKIRALQNQHCLLIANHMSSLQYKGAIRSSSLDKLVQVDKATFACPKMSYDLEILKVKLKGIAAHWPAPRQREAPLLLSGAAGCRSVAADARPSAKSAREQVFLRPRSGAPAHYSPPQTLLLYHQTPRYEEGLGKKSTEILKCFFSSWLYTFTL